MKWNLSVKWCSHQEDKVSAISIVLSFLQVWLVRRLSFSTLKVFVATIGAHQDTVYVKSYHQFPEGHEEAESSPSSPCTLLGPLLACQPCRKLFELLQSVQLKILSLKTALLTLLSKG